MQTVKRLFTGFLAAILAVSLWLPGAAQTATAAATYFLPDNPTLRNTAVLTLNDLSRENVYVTTNGTLTITGTFAYVSASSLSVRVEQLVQRPGGTSWEPDPSRVASYPVTADPGTTNRFTVNNLQLFPGFNRITFTGLQGSVERSDSFYVLYDSVVYLQNLRIISGNTQFYLNEGARVVVPNSSVVLQGVAQNATRVTVSVNGGNPILGSVLSDGTFFSPSLTLRPGLNTLTILIANATDSVTVSREVYYFDEFRPFVDVQLIHKENGVDVTYPLLNNTPKVTEGADTVTGSVYEQGQLLVQMLVKYSSTSFASSADIVLNDDDNATLTVASGDEIVIPGPDGITPQYRLVKFTTSPFTFSHDGSKYDRKQDVELTVTYGQFTATFEGSFLYLPNEIAINNIWYLANYNDSNGTYDDIRPLNGAEVDSSTFYVLVETDKAASANLKARYLPVGTVDLNVAVATTQPSGLPNNQKVYRVSGFTPGQHIVEFYYDGSSTGFIANVTYVTKTYIHISNLYDGQTFRFDSRLTNDLTITGAYVGFAKTSDPQNDIKPQYFINGEEITNPQLTLQPSASNPNILEFSLKLNISLSGPLLFGENRITFRGTNMTADGVTQEIVKDIRIYIVDTYVSTIDRFMPTLPNKRFQFNPSYTQPGQYTQEQLAQIFAVAPEFQLQNDRYVTSERSYDLVMRGGGATIVNLMRGSETFLRLNLPASPSLTPGTFNYGGTEYKYELLGDQNDFILRIQDIVFEQPGSHVYNLELINGTGARTRQRLEIVRELAPFRILSPRPTVGDRIVVNKNFVRFDIEAEGATQVLINKEPAQKRPDLNDRFVYDYVGLKPDRANRIDIEIHQPGNTLKTSVEVYYTSDVTVDSQYMMPLSTRMNVFNGQLTLQFPRGTVLKSAYPNQQGVTKFYTDSMILFGIADPKDGVVERRNDYGNIINVDQDARSVRGETTIIIPDYLVQRFLNTTNTFNFTRVSPIYWIHGGVGELGNRGEANYKPATNGLPPYSLEGRFTEFEPERKVVPSQRGTLTLSFDPSIVDEAAYTITVFRYTDRGVWENIGGEVNIRNHTITVPFDDFGYYMVAKLRRSYSDVTNHPWARNYLNGLYAKGIMTNLRFDEFGADNLTTRGEFATLLVKALNLPLNYDGNQTFFDVVPGARSATWDYEHIETAARAGIVTGLSEGFFGPDLPITREEAAVMIARALKLKLSVNNSKLEASLAKMFADSGNIQYYARPAVEAVAKAQIMVGSPTTSTGQNKTLYNFNPRANMTRAEAGKVAVVMLQRTTNIFPKNLS